MGVFLADGTRVTKATIPTTTPDDPLVEITQTLYQTRQVSGIDTVDGSLKTVLCRAGTVVPQSYINRLFLPATIGSLSAISGPAAGGTVVTIRGTNLSGASAVQFDAINGTNLTVVSATELRVTTPAHSAGLVNVVVVDDSGNATASGAFTYV